MGMLYAAIDIHKSVLQAAVLDPESGELNDARFPATREALREWATPLHGQVAAVAIEATSGWRWVWRELSALGFEVQLAEPAQTRALRGRKRKAKNDRLDARWLALLLAKAMLPQSWIPPEDIQRLRDLSRLRQALRHDRTSWAQRLHAVLAHEGWPCSRSELLSAKGRRWLDGLQLDAHVRSLVEAHLAIVDARCFRRADQIVRVAGLDPVVLDSAETKRRGKLSKQGSPHLRWALVQAAQHAAIHPASSPDGDHYLALKERIGSQRAAVSTAGKIAKRAYHVLAALEDAA
jgi:transposase